MTASALLTVTNLACQRGGRMLFSGLSFAVPKGGALLLTGPNGAGKSSLMRALAGLLPPAAGSIACEGRVVWLGHDNALKEHRRLDSELRWWAALDGAPAARVAAALDQFDLAPLAALPVRVLSSGQRRRAALARMWQAGADLWLLDEPTVGLDAASVARLAALMAAHRAGGGAVVAATHVDLGLVDAVSLQLGRAVDA